MRSPLTDLPLAKIWEQILARNPKMGYWHKEWKKSLTGNVPSPLDGKLPWITYEAIDWLGNHLKPDMRVFEWGSGGSTMFFASRVHSVITVEHDSKWHSEVMKSLKSSGINNVQLLLRQPVKEPNRNEQFSCRVGLYDGFSFEPYVRTIEDYPNSYFDLVMVDGRARIACVKHAVDKIKPNGYLILDNTERKAYLPVLDYVGDWKEIEFTGAIPKQKDYIAQSTIWQKPQS